MSKLIRKRTKLIITKRGWLKSKKENTISTIKINPKNIPAVTRADITERKVSFSPTNIARLIVVKIPENNPK